MTKTTETLKSQRNAALRVARTATAQAEIRIQYANLIRTAERAAR